MGNVTLINPRPFANTSGPVTNSVQVTVLEGIRISVSECMCELFDIWPDPFIPFPHCHPPLRQIFYPNDRQCYVNLVLKTQAAATVKQFDVSTVNFYAGPWDSQQFSWLAVKRV
jgi:hypothetical protein